jgi:hypothetical protein
MWRNFSSEKSSNKHLYLVTFLEHLFYFVCNFPQFARVGIAFNCVRPIANNPNVISCVSFCGINAIQGGAIWFGVLFVSIRIVEVDIKDGAFCWGNAFQEIQGNIKRQIIFVGTFFCLVEHWNAWMFFEAAIVFVFVIARLAIGFFVLLPIDTGGK